ncbi:hypothetical protein HY224_00480 [Candidatus Uhrbacteria bacterium]|nr:hypothetical protein [Candidatus Uhrbacteria bacterium]
MEAILFFLAVGLIFTQPNIAWAGTLSCTVATTCASGAVVFRIAATSNSHAELPSQSLYSQLVCCTGVTGLSNSCSGTFATVLKLQATTNSHVEQNSLSNYTNSVCLSVPAGGSVSVGYQSTNCSGFDTTVGSMSATTNAHVGDSTAFTTKICATGAGSVSQSLTFAISANSINFGTLDTAAARFATTTSGSSSEAEAHNFTVSTNATNGYTVTVKGATLTSGGATITAIGGTNTASATNTEQFGLRINAAGGSGAVTAPYAASGFAYAATSSTTSQVASAPSGDGVTTTYSVRYIANISSTTESGSYTATLNYVATANF